MIVHVYPCQSNIDDGIPPANCSRYLLLCRYLTWHFADVVAMASAICEVVRPEEQQLWECHLGHPLAVSKF